MNNFRELELAITKWAENKDLLKPENSFQQITKTMEELGEVASALCKKKPDLLVDSIGDCVVTLIILARQNNLNMLDCLQVAWDEIKDRKGKTIDGVFIKNEI